MKLESSDYNRKSMPVNFAPESEQQIAELVHWAFNEERSITIQGHGTKQHFGRITDTDCLLSLANITGVMDYRPEELVMTARAGTPLKTIYNLLAEQRQHLAFEPPELVRLYGHANDLGTIGGVFMGNLSGPRRFLAGAARDHLLGFRAVNGRGEMYKSGGTVIKNVTGYDMSKLLAGSWGTLSVVSELSFKVLPAPAATRTLAVGGMMNMPEAAELVRRLAGSPYAVSGLALIPENQVPRFRPELDTQGNTVLVRLEGSKAANGESLAAIKTLLPASARPVLYDTTFSISAWATVRDAGLFADPGRALALLKLSIPPGSFLDITRVIDQLGGCDWYADAALGWIWVAICHASVADKIAAIRYEVAAASGSAVLFRASDPIKQQAGIYSRRDEVWDKLTKRIKESFDPLRILNPGRLD